MKNGWTIKPLKTWYGMRWSVVDAKVSVAELKDRVASFSYDENGLAQAKNILVELRGGKVR